MTKHDRGEKRLLELNRYFGSGLFLAGKQVQLAYIIYLQWPYFGMRLSLLCFILALFCATVQTEYIYPDSLVLLNETVWTDSLQLYR